MTIYLIRHTAVEVPQGTCYGQTDVALKASFEEEAAMVSHRLKDIRPDIVFSSPLSRCTRLATFCGYPDAHLDNRLKELNFGEWEGQKWDELDMTIWKENWITPPPPGGESFIEMYERVADFFNELAHSNDHTILVFTHGGVINCARAYFHHLPLKDTFQVPTSYGEVMVFEH